MGQLSGTVTFGLDAGVEGATTLRIHYSNKSKDMRFQLAINGKVNGRTSIYESPRRWLHRSAGKSFSWTETSFVISWKSDAYDSIQLKEL